MKRIEPKEGQFVALTLNEHGANSFAYLKNRKAGNREVYFISYINIGSFSESIMLLGQFIFEFENVPGCALKMTPGGTNRIYFPNDKRIVLYDILTGKEKMETQNRLLAIAKEYPMYLDNITELIKKLE